MATMILQGLGFAPMPLPHSNALEAVAGKIGPPGARTQSRAEPAKVTPAVAIVPPRRTGCVVPFGKTAV